MRPGRLALVNWSLVRALSHRARILPPVSSRILFLRRRSPRLAGDSRDTRPDDRLLFVVRQFRGRRDFRSALLLMLLLLLLLPRWLFDSGLRKRSRKVTAGGAGGLGGRFRFLPMLHHQKGCQEWSEDDPRHVVGR